MVKKNSAAVIERMLRFGRNEIEGGGAHMGRRKTPVSVIYPPSGKVIRFVKHEHMLRPVSIDIARALVPNSDGYCSNGNEEHLLIANGNGWDELGVALTLEGALYIANNIHMRKGVRVPQSDIECMREFLVKNMVRCEWENQPDFTHEFGDRDEVCDEFGEDRAAICKLYTAAERENAKIKSGHVFNADLKVSHARTGSRRVFDRDEVADRAMVVFEWEQRVIAMRERAMYLVRLYKARWDIVRCDFADERLVDFSWRGHGAYLDAKRQLKLARARMATACMGHAKLMAGKPA
ncbi:hypothetical protein P3T18_005396 [Paraburkholderia sp. GAS199]|uniref:hypothetical protein n=1 Tax=Paraburkholderia sp. GAS199 TaxID=3035126 RepID=UPI003D19E67A